MANNDLINKVYAKGTEMRNARMSAEQRKKQVVIDKLLYIESLAPRIAKMWNTYQAILNNDMVLGTPKKEMIGYSLPYETDGCGHGLGFEVIGREVCGIYGGQVVSFGIKGGGCSGYSLLVNKEGDWGWYNRSNKQWQLEDIHRVDYRFGDYLNVPVYTNWTLTSKIEKFIGEFDEFESRFYADVEKLVR